MDRRARILIVDDDPDLLFAAKLTLARSYELRTAVNGLDGLSAAKAEAPDLILTDMAMPVMNGEALIASLCEHDHLRSLPILIMTGNVWAGKSQHFLQAGVIEDVLLKPFTAAELRAKVEKWLPARRAAAY